MYSDPHPRRPFIGWFLSGVLVSYLLNHESMQAPLARLRQCCGGTVGMLAMALLVLGFAASSVTIASAAFGERVNLVLQYRVLFGAAAAFLVFAAVVGSDSPYGRLLRWGPWRSFGIMGYSVYLVHPLLLEAARKFAGFYFGFRLTDVLLFLVVMAITWLVSLFTYNLIEYPFLSNKRRPADSEAAQRITAP